MAQPKEHNQQAAKEVVDQDQISTLHPVPFFGPVEAAKFVDIKPPSGCEFVASTLHEQCEQFNSSQFPEPVNNMNTNEMEVIELQLNMPPSTVSVGFPKRSQQKSFSFEDLSFINSTNEHSALAPSPADFTAIGSHCPTCRCGSNSDPMSIAFNQINFEGQSGTSILKEVDLD